MFTLFTLNAGPPPPVCHCHLCLRPAEALKCCDSELICSPCSHLLLQQRVLFTQELDFIGQIVSPPQGIPAAREK